MAAKQKPKSDLAYNQTIYSAIRKIAWHKGGASSDVSFAGAERFVGFVRKVNLEGELAGTVDVQDLYNMPQTEEDDGIVGYHQGVLLSAIQDNKGFVIIPKMYSEVIVAKISSVGTATQSSGEYVAMFSHVDTIKLDSHDTITVGVTEREKFDESDEDSDDVNELKETGVFTSTQYTKDTIATEVHKEKDSHITKETMTGEQYALSVDDDATTVTVNKEQVAIKRENGTVTIKTDNIESKVGSSSVIVEDGKVHLGSKSGTDNAVLGKELATILSDFLGYMGQMMTTTMMGPQPPINMASFIALKAKVDAYKASQSGFLTQKVMVQK